MIKHIERGHGISTLRPQCGNVYGETVQNNVGVFQGSAMGSLFCTIYLGGAMGDYNALRIHNNIVLKHAPEMEDADRSLKTSKNVRREFAKHATEQKETFIRQTFIYRPGIIKNTNPPTWGTYDSLKRKSLKPRGSPPGIHELQPNDHQEYADGAILDLEPRKTDNIELLHR